MVLLLSRQHLIGARKSFKETPRNNLSRRDQIVFSSILFYFFKNRIRIYLPLEKLQRPCDGNTHNYHETVANKTIHVYAEIKMSQTTD